MTKKLNLSPLIKHFENKDPQIANRLFGLTASSKNNKMQQIAAVLIEAANKYDKTNPELAKEADALLKSLVREAQNLDPNKVQQFQAGYGKSEGPGFFDKAKNWVGKQIQDRKDKLNSGSGQKMMEPMMESTGDCMDSDPGEETVVLVVEDIDSMGGDKMMSEMMDAPVEDKEMLVSVEDLVEEQDPEIDEIVEPEAEHDIVGLEDIKEELEHMKFRIADKKKREALEEAIEHIEKAMDYHDASRRRRDKVHSIFDGAGLALRLKDFE